MKSLRITDAEREGIASISKLLKSVGARESDPAIAHSAISDGLEARRRKIIAIAKRTHEEIKK